MSPSGPTRKSFGQSVSNMSRTHHNVPSRAAPGPPGSVQHRPYQQVSACFSSSPRTQPEPSLSFFLIFFCLFVCFAVSHQNGGLKNTNHLANQRNSHHHNQKHSSHGNASRPFLPSNINQQRQRGSSRLQPDLDCLKVPDQGAAG